MKQYQAYLVHWLEQQRRVLGASSYVVGLSGGIDSAVVAMLLSRTNTPVEGIILPSATTSKQDVEHAKSVAKVANIPVIEVSISPVYSEFMHQFQSLFNPQAERQQVIAGNVQARLRMMALYAYAQSHQSVVVGTDNAAEWHMGYFTKFGDGGVDLAPLLSLRKEQVYELAKLLGVPQVILDKSPSAGLWAGQTDEAEMGVSYAEIDAFLRGEAISPTAQQQIDFWHRRSSHKRRLAPSPLSPLEWKSQSA